MRHYFKLEWNRAFFSRSMALSLLIGCSLSVWHFWDYIWPVRDYVMGGEYPLSSFDRWIGGENYSLQATIYFLLLPILCALPYGESWLFDRSTGYGNQAILRKGQKEYVRTKYLVMFLSGATVALLPLLFDFLITNLVAPAVLPQAGYGLSPIFPMFFMADCYYTHPFLYLLVYLTMDGIFFGLFNTLAFAAANVCRNRFLVQLTPFLVYLFLFCLGTTTEQFSMCPTGFLRPSQRFMAALPWIAGEAVILLTVGLLAVYRAGREEMGLL